jgi:hypothetical protein
LGGDFQEAGRAEREQTVGGARDRRPCTHVDLGSPPICGIPAVGYMKGKSAIHVARTYGGREYILLNDRYPLVSSAVKKLSTIRWTLCFYRVFSLLLTPLEKPDGSSIGFNFSMNGDPPAVY